MNKRTIVLDYDDTLVRSSEIVIKILNKKNNTNHTIEDLRDWTYNSIDPTLTSKDVYDIYESGQFWECVNTYPLSCLNHGVQEFIETFKSEFEFVVCSIGTPLNLEKKKNHCSFLRDYFKADLKFVGMPVDGKSEDNTLNKSCIDFSRVYLFIDDNTSAIQTSNAPKKILLKNYHEVYWNETPKNSEDIYVVNTFDEITQMIKFDLEEW